MVVDGHSDILIPVTEGKMDLGDRVAVPGLDWAPPPGLELAGTLGLTKPTLKLTKTYGESRVEPQATDRISLIVKRGLQDEVSAMPDYLHIGDDR